MSIISLFLRFVILLVIYEVQIISINTQFCDFTALKLLYGQRDIRGVAHYGLDSIDGGYSCSFSGNLWLDYQTDSDAKSSLSLDSHYSIADGYRSLSTATDLQIYVPTFNNDKVKT